MYLHTKTHDTKYICLDLLMESVGEHEVKRDSESHPIHSK